MIRRREFSTAIRVAAVKRANGLCEAKDCGLPHLGRFEIDHVIADALGGEPVLSNAMVLCAACHGTKTKRDVMLAAKTKRQEAAALHARPAPKRPIRSAGFPKSSKRATNPTPGLPRRALYVGAN